MENQLEKKIENEMENEMEAGIILGLYWGNIWIMENQMETTIMDVQMEKMENDMEDGVIRGIVGMHISYRHGFLSGDYIWRCTKLQEEPYVRLYPRQQMPAKKRTRGQRWGAW